MAVAQDALLPTPSERQPSLSATLLAKSEDHSPRPARKERTQGQPFRHQAASRRNRPHPQKGCTNTTKGAPEGIRQVKGTTQRPPTLFVKKGENEGTFERLSELHGLTGMIAATANNAASTRTGYNRMAGTSARIKRSLNDKTSKHKGMKMPQHKLLTL